MNYSVDVGNNLTSLGFTFLFLKYLLPVLIGFIIAAAGFLGLRSALKKLNLDLTNKEQLMTIAVMAILIFALIYNSTH